MTSAPVSASVGPFHPEGAERKETVQRTVLAKSQVAWEGIKARYGIDLCAGERIGRTLSS